MDVLTRTKVLFAAKNKLGLLEGTRCSLLDSQYLKDYKSNLEQIRRKRAWKTGGSGAAFRGDVDPYRNVDFDTLMESATINGLSFTDVDDRIVYSVSIEQSSGVFFKNPGDASEVEGHILHGREQSFHGLDYNTATGEIAVAICEGGLERHIALLDTKRSSYRIITEGDCIDENPVWCRSSRALYYDSAGIGRNINGVFAGYSPRTIHRLDLDTGELSEVVSLPRYDCFSPRTDGYGKLYFLKRPFRPAKNGQGFSVIDILLIPVRLVKAIFGWLQIFTMSTTGEPLLTNGPNPGKTRRNAREIQIDGNLINAEKTLRENSRKGDTYPGIAPRSWELIKRGTNGEMSVVKQCVIDFDVNSEGEIFYSNGKYLIHLDRDGKEVAAQPIEFARHTRVSG
jgi:hypothetical protein